MTDKVDSAIIFMMLSLDKIKTIKLKTFLTRYSALRNENRFTLL